MKSLNFAFIKLSIIFLLGIVAGFYFSFSIETVLFPLIVLFIFFIPVFIRAQQQLFRDSFFGLIAFSLVFTLGIFTVSLHLPQNQEKHYIHQIDKTQGNALLKIEVFEKLKPTPYNQRYLVKSQKIINPEEISNVKEVKGKILLTLPSDSATVDYAVGDNLLVPFNLTDINAPLNPYQFNYREHMRKTGVLQQLQLKPAEVLPLSLSENNFYSLAASFREKIIGKLQQKNIDPEELAIIQALLLGQRQDISEEIYQNYTAAGAIHILAVSGLHVGLILLILNFIFRPLDHLKYGKLAKTLILLFLLWSFAVIAGLSPSVVRAVSMFSFVAIGMQLNRKTSVMNSLFISLFFLLLINPAFIHQVGFQLSYLAVFSIVAIQPFLFDLHVPRKKVFKYLWGLLTVTFAAQIGVLPLSLYYFHQFPGLFFLSNLVILPFLGLILGAGILVIALALLDMLPLFLARLYAACIEILNNFIAWVAHQEAFLFQDVPFSILQAVTAYLIVLGIIFTIQRRSFKNAALLLGGIIAFQAVFIYHKAEETSEEVIVFHKSRKTIIASKKGDLLQVYHNLDTTASAETILQNYKTGKNIRQIKNGKLQNFYSFSDQNLLVIDSSGLFTTSNFHPQVVLLSNSPKVNLDRVLQELQPEQIIADGSNYTSYVLRWAATCSTKKIPFHHTGKRGAFKIKGKSLPTD